MLSRSQIATIPTLIEMAAHLEKSIYRSRRLQMKVKSSRLGSKRTVARKLGTHFSHIRTGSCGV
jgi:hypothetical protein